MNQLEEIKKRIDIVELINEYLPLKKAGRNFKALCPFHTEKTPSFIVSPERQIWHCFGACNTGGDIFGFLMKMENMEFAEALRVLAKRAGVKLTRYKPPEGARQKQLLYEINHLASELYHFLLLNHPVGKRALEYILGRGISQQSLQLFKLGFAPNTWDALQKFLVGKKGYKPEDLEKTGLIIKSEKGKGFYDRFRGRLIFPLKDHRGNVCGFAGRILGGNPEQPKYINTPETMIYHKSSLLYGLSETKEAIKKADQAILVEGELDVISSYQTGVKNVVAIKGSALSQDQIRLLSRFTKNIVFALDCDLAGDQAARRGIEVAEAAEMSTRVVELEGGKDPDEIAQKDPSLWRELVKKAVPVYDYFLDSAFSRFDSTTAEGKRKIGQELIPVWAKISDEIVRAHYIKQLAERLGVPEEAIVAEMAKVKEKPITSVSVLRKEGAGEEKSRREILEEYLLALGFQSGDWRRFRKRKVISLVKTPRFVRILKILTRYLKRYKTIKSARLAKMLPPELVDSFDQLYLLDLAGITEDEEKLEREFDKALVQLERLNLRERLGEISEAIKGLEKDQSARAQKKTEKLYQEFRDLSLRLSQLEEGKGGVWYNRGQL